MKNPWEEEIGKESGRILSRDLFLRLLDLEVKRARRYQNFLSLLIVKLIKRSSQGEPKSLRSCHDLLAGLLANEMRETDILGSFGEDRLMALLPYADAGSGDVAKARFENLLRFCNLKENGYETIVRQVSFPRHGTSAVDLIEKGLGEEPHLNALG